MEKILVGQDNNNPREDYAEVWQHELLTTVDMVMALQLANSRWQGKAIYVAPSWLTDMRLILPDPFITMGKNVFL